MHRFALRFLFLAEVVALAACESSSSPSAGPTSPDSTATPVEDTGAPPSSSLVDGSDAPTFVDAAGPTSACGDPGTALAGAGYDIALSRFAWGSPPVQTTANGSTRWEGKDGVVVIGVFGEVIASMNAGASARDRPDWNADTEALKTHVRDYFTAFGVEQCQIARIGVLGSGQGGGSSSGGSPDPSSFRRTIHLSRAVDGIAIGESKAYARINDLDQSVEEGFLWPTLLSSIITEARSFRDELADSTKLAAYKAKLPPNAQGEGAVVIHHSSGLALPRNATAFKSGVSWDTMMSSSPVSFDRDGKQLPPTPW